MNYPTLKTIVYFRLMFIGLILLAVTAEGFAQRKFVGKVVEVIDGRTVVLEMESGRVTAQMEYIEIPALGDPLHKVVTEHLAGLVLGKAVDFRPNGMANKRTFGQIYIDGIDVAQQLLRDGAVRHAPTVKYGQITDESGIYRQNEELAKSEQRGIWALDESRSPKIKSVRFETDRDTPLDRWTVYLSRSDPNGSIANTTSHSNARTGRSNVRQAGYTGIWAGVEDDEENGFLAGYDREGKEGFTASPVGSVVLVGPRFDHDADVRLIYVYGGEPSRIAEDAYLIALKVQTGEPKFDSFNEMILSADGRNYRLGHAKYLSRKNDDGMEELLIYEIEKDDLIKIAEAKKIGFRLGSYSAAAGQDVQQQMRDLISMTK